MYSAKKQTVANFGSRFFLRISAKKEGAVKRKPLASFLHSAFWCLLYDAVVAGLEICVLASGDNVELLLAREVDKLDRVAGHANRKVGVFGLFGVLHAIL